VQVAGAALVRAEEACDDATLTFRPQL